MHVLLGDQYRGTGAAKLPQELADPLKNPGRRGQNRLSPLSRAVTDINLPVDAGYIAGTTWAA